MKKAVRPALYLILSFALPFLLILIADVGLEIAPFGDHTLVISDANGYYINTLSYAGRMLRGLEGFTYSFEKGLGGNMIGHLNGILLTPFAFLLGFFDISRYPSVFTFISALNLSLAGLTMYLFLAGVYGPKRSHLLFSTAYALMGFQTANVFQAVFFCAAPVLPLMALGLRRLLQGKSPILYILTLACGLLMNAYFGFVLCVASVLFFFTALAFGGEELRGKRLRLFVQYALSSLCGGLLAVFLWLPAFLSLSGGRLNQTDLTDFHFYERQPLLEIGAKLFMGANSTAELVNGHPNIYVGLLPVALTVLFFLNKGVEKRKKAAAGVLLGVYLLAFTVLAFDMLMHGGTTTNWFNFRYSYVFSFLLLAIAASLWEKLEEVPYGDMKRCLGILAVTAVLVFSKRYEFVYAGEVLLDFGLLLLAFLALWMHRRNPGKNPKSTFERTVLLLVCIGLFLNYRISTKNIREWEHKASEYRETVFPVSALTDAVQETDGSFFRMEVNRQRSGTCGNDPLLYGYNGVGHGGSNERDFVRTEGNKLGIPSFSNRSYYADGVPGATDSLLGLKYVVAEEDLAEEKGYVRRAVVQGWSLYENPDALPVAVLASGDMDSVETDFVSIFENLNQVWASLSGKETPIFTEEDEITFFSHNLTDPAERSAREAREAMSRLDAEAESTSSRGEESESPVNADSTSQIRRTEVPEGTAYIAYTFTAKRDGPIFVYERNGLTDTGGSMTPAVGWLGNFRAGDTVTGYIRANLASISDAIMDELCGRFRAAYADPEALHALSEEVRSRPVTAEKRKDSHLSGTFAASEGQTLLFTIPWDEGWALTVDGQRTELRKVFGLFMAAEVPAGEHSYELKFTPAGLKTGLLISLVTLLFTLCYLAFGKKAIDRAFAPREEKLRAAEEAEPETGTDAAETEEDAREARDRDPL